MRIHDNHILISQPDNILEYPTPLHSDRVPAVGIYWNATPVTPHICITPYGFADVISGKLRPKSIGYFAVNAVREFVPDENEFISMTVTHT